MNPLEAMYLAVILPLAQGFADIAQGLDYLAKHCFELAGFFNRRAAEAAIRDALRGDASSAQLFLKDKEFCNSISAELLEALRNAAEA